MIEFRWFQSLKLPPSPLTFVGAVKEESYGALEINPDTVWRYRHTKGLTFQFWSHPERLDEQAWPNVIVDSAYFSISKNFLTFHENIFPMLCCFALWLFFVSKWCCIRKLLGLEISNCIRISTILTMQHKRNWSIIIFDTEAERLCIGNVFDACCAFTFALKVERKKNIFWSHCLRCKQWLYCLYEKYEIQKKVPNYKYV